MRRPDERPVIKIGKGTFAEVIHAFYDSHNFTKLERGTQQNYRHYLGIAERADVLGAKPVELMRPSLVQGFLDAFADRPGAQKMARTAIKAVEAWALVRDFLPWPIALGTKIVGSDGGHKPWTDAQVELAEREAAPHIARVVMLASNTGQRGSDLVKMHPNDLEEIDGRLGIHVTQQKTGRQLWIPLTQQLIAAMQTWRRTAAPFLLRPDGKPWQRTDLTMAWVRERRLNPKLEPCRDLVLHGLRATACVRLRRAGASVLQISDLVGLSPMMVERYTRFAKQVENALAGMEFLDRTSGEQISERQVVPFRQAIDK